MNEIEVFRIEPKIGKCYEHVECTRKEGIKRCFTSVPLKYVGKKIRREEGGWGDNGWVRDIFFDGQKLNIINYSYEGRTCFREVPQQTPTYIDDITNLSRKIPSLQTLAFQNLSTVETEYLSNFMILRNNT